MFMTARGHVTLRGHWLAAHSIRKHRQLRPFQDRIVDCLNHSRKEPYDMPLVNLVIALIIVGVALWMINSFIPMASSIKSILNIVVVIAVVVWILQVTGLWGPIASYRISAR